MKTVGLIAVGIFMLGAAGAADAHDWKRHKGKGFFDRVGDRIDRRLDRRGERINDRLDERAERALERGRPLLAERLDRRGDRIERRLDFRGDRIERRFDRRDDWIDRRFDHYRGPYRGRSHSRHSWRHFYPWDWRR